MGVSRFSDAPTKGSAVLVWVLNIAVIKNLGLVHKNQTEVIIKTRNLSTQTEALNEAAVALDIYLLQVAEQTTTLTNEQQQTAT